jgi:hypothetical protein
MDLSALETLENATNSDKGENHVLPNVTLVFHHADHLFCLHVSMPRPSANADLARFARMHSRSPSKKPKK